MNLERINTQTTWEAASSSINNNNARINEAVVRLENSTYKNKGYFKTLEDLNANYPSPSTGSLAYVGTTYPFRIYLWNKDTATWEDCGMTGGDPDVNLNNYYTKAETDNKVSEASKAIDSRIAQETGDSEVLVMSQKAVTEKLSELASKANELQTSKAEKTALQEEINRAKDAELTLTNTKASKAELQSETNRATSAERVLDNKILEEIERAQGVEVEQREDFEANKFGFNVTVYGEHGGVHNLLSAIKDMPKKYRMLGQKITFRTENGDWATYHNESLSLANYENTKDWVQEVGIKEVTGDVNIENAPDYEDLTEAGNGTIKFADKEYSKASFSGLGRIYLRKNIVDGMNILSQDMLVKDNTRYVIQYDYNLNGQTVEVPENCVLQFDGGSIANGTIKGTFEVRTSKNDILFNNVSVEFKITNHTIESEWFGEISESVDSSIAINKSLSASQSTNVVRFPMRSFTVANPIVVSSTRTIDGRNYKNRIGTNVIIPTANISVFVIGSGFIDGSLRNISIQPRSSSSQLRNYVGVEMTGCESFVVENVKVQYADIAYKLVTQTQISLPTFKDISAHDCNTGVKIEGVGSGWANGVSIKPYWFTNNYVHFHILGGQVTTIQGGSVEVGYSINKPSWFGDSPRGVITENDAVVNIFGCLWAENVGGYYFDVRGFSKVNIYGDIWLSDKIKTSEYGQVYYFGSTAYGELGYKEYPNNVKDLPIQYLSAKNASKGSYGSTFIDIVGKGFMPKFSARILKMTDGRPYLNFGALTSQETTNPLSNFTIAIKYVKTSYPYNITALLGDGTWSGCRMELSETIGSSILAIYSANTANSLNAFFFNKKISNEEDLKDCVCFVAFDGDNQRLIMMDVNGGFFEKKVTFMNKMSVDPYNWSITPNGVPITDVVLFDKVLEAEEFKWWMEYLKKGGAESLSIGTKRPDTAEIGHSFFNSSTGILSIKTSEGFDSSTLTSVTWKEINSAAVNVSETE